MIANLTKHTNLTFHKKDPIQNHVAVVASNEHFKILTLAKFLAVQPNALGSLRQGLLGSPQPRPREYQGTPQSKIGGLSLLLLVLEKNVDVQYRMDFSKEVPTQPWLR